MTAKIELHHLDLMLDQSGKDFTFHRYFNRNLMVAFGAWQQDSKNVKKLLKNDQISDLKPYVIELVDKVAQLEIGWTRALSKTESEWMNLVDDPFTRWEKEYGFWTNEKIKKLPDIGLTEKEFFTGVIFINIDRVWTLMQDKDCDKNNRYYLELYERISWLSETTSFLLKSCEQSIRALQAADAKREVIEKARKLWCHYKLGRDGEAASRLKELYYAKYGKKLTQSVPTIRDTWFPEWRRS